MLKQKLKGTEDFEGEKYTHFANEIINSYNILYILEKLDIDSRADL